MSLLATPARHRKRRCQTAEGPCLSWALVVPVRHVAITSSSILMLVKSRNEQFNLQCHAMPVNNLMASCKAAAAAVYILLGVILVPSDRKSVV